MSKGVDQVNVLKAYETPLLAHDQTLLLYIYIVAILYGIALSKEVCYVDGMAQMNTRISRSLKERGDAALEKAGMTPSQAVRKLWTSPPAIA